MSESDDKTATNTTNDAKPAHVRRAELLTAQLEVEMAANPMFLLDPLCLVGLLRFVATGEQIVTPHAVASKRHDMVRAYLRGGGTFSTVFMHVLEADTSEVP